MTDLIIWTPELSVGIAILDEDHKRILKMINKIYAAIYEDKGRDVVADIIHDLFAYMQLHFESEEAFFDETGYEGGDEQKAQHKDMRDKALLLKKKFLGNPDSVMPVEILVFLKDWWTGHIINSDKKYAAYLNAHGIK